MAERKIFAGPRLRRLRRGLGLTQAQMAAEIGISASYLNLIERNQRPLTVQVILKLSATYDVDLGRLHDADAGARLDDLKAVFADPLLAAELPSTDELAEVAEAAPNVGIAVSRLHRAYRETLARLSDLSRDIAKMAADGQAAGPPEPAAEHLLGELPHDRVRRWFEAESPWFAELEAAADRLAGRLTPRDDPFAAVRAALSRDHRIDVRILPVETMPDELSRYDRHAMRLYLSERLPLVERPFFAANLLVALTEDGLLDRLAAAAGVGGPEAIRLCRVAFCRRLAAAALLPGSRLARLAAGAIPEIGALARRNTLTPARVMGRLAAAGATAGPVPPAFLLTVDAAGTVLNRVAGGDFPFARFGTPCAMLPLFDAMTPESLVAGPVEFPDGSVFQTTVAVDRHLVPVGSGTSRRTATMIAFSLPATPAQDAPARPVGAGCRLCERNACPGRIGPPATEPAAIRDDLIGLARYEAV